MEHVRCFVSPDQEVFERDTSAFPCPLLTLGTAMHGFSKVCFWPCFYRQEIIQMLPCNSVLVIKSSTHEFTTLES